MIVRTDILEAIEYEDYFGGNIEETLANLQESDSSYTLKEAIDYSELTYVGDQLEWADLNDGVICSTKVFKKGEEYWGCDWEDTNGNDFRDEWTKLYPLIETTKVYYTPENIPEIPAVTIDVNIN